MKMNPLGRTGLHVSELCLGTMTYGTQTSQADAHAQIDRALEAGINFLDAAELYPVNPISAETQGRTEEIIGNWFTSTGRRTAVVMATKHGGEGVKHLRDGAPITAKSLPETIEGSLKRLQTDYIDLYQFHWPNRGSYMFRKNWDYDPTAQDTAETLDNMCDVMEALKKEVARGTIRHFGLSNESAWGTMQWLRIAQETGGPRVASIQNEYSLACRLFDTDLAELSTHEDVGLMAFSPLAAGLLTGKYQNGAVPDGSRMSYGGNLGGRASARIFDAVQAYLDVAKKHELDPVQMAIAFTVQRPFTYSTIIGATNFAQLEHLLAGAGMRLSDAVLADITQVHRAHPLPY